MNSNRFARLGVLFAAARKLDGDQRERFLRIECGQDDELRGELEELLAEDARRGSGAIDRLIVEEGEMPPTPAPEQSVPEAEHPTRIGRFQILRICGSGGMGTVYEAIDDLDGARAAVKVMRSGGFGPEMEKRFRREADILAKLEHPFVARVLDAGEVAGAYGRLPYLAMEFVDGLPPLEFADRHALGVTGRLDIFLHICEAIRYAHSQGVVHRDLKPDNILVIEAAEEDPGVVRGHPKVLDFGIAGLSDADTHVTMITGAGQLLGSVPYMSPEQATGDTESIDARSDVYSLGVVLFELLTGRLPYAVSELPLADALHVIRHGEPTRLGAADPALRGDLETIVGKCLEKEGARRYETVGAVAADLRRFRSRQPITARGPSTWLQLRRFASRNRALVGGICATALALLVGAIIAVVFAVDATRSAERARSSQRLSERQAYRANLEAVSALLESDPGRALRLLNEIPERARGWEWRYLKAACSGLELEFGTVRQASSLPHVSWIPEEMGLLEGGEQVVALEEDAKFTVWGTRSGRALRSFSAPGPVRVWVLSEAGNLLVAALEDGQVFVTDPRAAELEWEAWLQGGETVHAVAVAPEGDRIAVHGDAEIRIGRPGQWCAATVSPRSAWNQPLLGFSADGSRLISLDGDSLILRDPSDGMPVGERIPSTQGHWSIASLPDGRIVSGQYRREVRRYDPSTGKRDLELLGHTGAVRDLAVSPGNRVVSVGGRFIRVHDLDTSETIAVFDAPGTRQAEFVDETHILSLTAGRLRLWSLEGRRARILSGHDDHVFSAAFSSDGELLATAAPWGRILVWDPLETAPLRQFDSALKHQHLTFDDSGEHLGSSWQWWRPYAVTYRDWASTGVREVYPSLPCVRFGTSLGRVRIDGLEGDEVSEDMHVFCCTHDIASGGHEVRVDGRATTLRPAEDPAASPQLPNLGAHTRLSLGRQHGSCFGGAVAEFLVFRGRLTAPDASAVERYLSARSGQAEQAALEMTPAGRSQLLAHYRADESSVRVNDRGQVAGWAAHDSAAPDLRAHGSSGGVTFLPADAEQPARVQFFNSWGSLRWLEADLRGAAESSALTVCWLGSFPRGGHHIAYGIGSHEPTPPGSPGSGRALERCRRISYSGTGKLVANSGKLDFSGPLDVWDVETGESVMHVDGRYNGISFHPRDDLIAASCEDGGIEILEVPSGRLRHRIEAHVGSCFDVAFSPDGTRLASCGNDLALRIWDAVEFDRLLDFPGHRSYVMGVTWSPDGDMLVSVGGDRQVRIYDAVSRRERYAERSRRAEQEEAVRERVESIERAAGEPDEVARTVRSQFPAGSWRRRAALRLLSRKQ